MRIEKVKQLLNIADIFKLNIRTTPRIVFHEITKKAITKAIQNPRTINMSLVKAQQYRQILDYLVGFELSPFCGNLLLIIYLLVESNLLLLN